jgi:predicted nucleotidyltransferase
MNEITQQVVARNVAKSLQKSNEVLAVWHFGASERGRVWADSDVDLLVVTTTPTPAHSTHAVRNDIDIHFHWWAEAAFWDALEPQGDLWLHAAVATGKLLFDRTGVFQRAAGELRTFPERYCFYHLIPPMEALLAWARDLNKRMALGDERPRRAQHRLWEVDNKAANILLIEKGVFPHNEATTQALNERLFVPNLASPEEIEAFIAPRMEQWVLPQLAQWQTHDFDSASLQHQYGISDSTHLLAFAHRMGKLKTVRVAGRGGVPIQEQVYRLK